MFSSKVATKAGINNRVFFLTKKIFVSYISIFILFSMVFMFFLYSSFSAYQKLGLISTVEVQNNISLIAVNKEIILPLIVQLVLLFFLIIVITLLVIVFIIKQIRDPLVAFIVDLKKITGTGNFVDRFDCSSSSRIINNLATALNAAFDRMIEFDQLKANKIATTSNIIRDIINDVDEGILIIDKGKIITAINGAAEKYLKINSGEANNKSVFRYMNNEKLFSFINKAINEGSNIINESIEYRKGDTLCFDVIGYVDKFKRSSGAIIVIKGKKNLQPFPSVAYTNS
ncbi:MAG: hypothetical protein DKM50_13860 [Candidatus Margulisiibacteriota bacterium]|nr:MAG: hypothetical protein A2X43_09035 [Candidatus Margulisbacteria bacterium GWD2_39_127]OGI03568.1 MAG: hypothetical protein A2X42_00875 [Candidatus Margulisbacteria bacterium GWF2_38_17]OGI11073.1 MAG: hypothetical protein A2X41_02170 [Candidatus Margulisbacteria bacterium GWE2_39_32]PZM77072.1 MAG: hypothetical protein DKM50_13860 [Candidatus Margulisiibacteriota bacterium]HAR62331.1 hypothetical protein [Candidatus Margulisiibacteriota bacterium]